MSGSRGLLASALVLGATFAGAGEPSPSSPSPSDVRVAHGATVTRLDAVLPGALVSYALPRGRDGSREIVLLVRPPAPAAETGTPPPAAASDHASPARKSKHEQAPKARREFPPCPQADGPGAASTELPLALYTVDTAGSRLVELRDDLPSDATALDAVDLGGEDGETLILARPGELLRVDRHGSAPPESLLVEDGAGWAALDPRAVRHPGLDDRPWAVASGLGRLSLYGPLSSDAANWVERARVGLPREANIDADGIRVWSPEPQLVGLDPEGTLYFATPPSTFGSTRVQTTLIAVAASGETTVTDCWARLPSAEEILDSSFLLIDDRPVLMVTTKPADKLNLFGEKWLRLYALERDRSRLGLLPLFAGQTRMNLWQEATPRLIDVDRDGRDDLVIGYWKGILHDRVVLDVYLRTADGGFDPSERNTALDVPKGDRDFVGYGADLTGDGIPDLLVRGKAGLLVYPGRASKHGKRLVDDRPTTIRLSKKEQRTEEGLAFTTYTHARPRVIDLDGDGRSEILLVSRGGPDARGVFTVLWPGG